MIFQDTCTVGINNLRDMHVGGGSRISLFNHTDAGDGVRFDCYKTIFTGCTNETIRLKLSRNNTFRKIVPYGHHGDLMRSFKTHRKDGVRNEFFTSKRLHAFNNAVVRTNPFRNRRRL